jgi:hypothetical protein
MVCHAVGCDGLEWKSIMGMIVHGLYVCQSLACGFCTMHFPSYGRISGHGGSNAGVEDIPMYSAHRLSSRA